MSPLRSREDYLMLSSVPTQNQQIQQAPFLQWENKRDDPTVQWLLLGSSLSLSLTLRAQHG